MLDEIRIQSLGVIGDAVLELGPGFTVVTGETGAGKTMVVQSLSLLLGGRADAGLVRTGAERAVVEGRVRVPADGAVVARAVEAGADIDDDELIVTRTVAANGRSRAHLGGRAVPVSVLDEIGEHLVAVHGQSDQQRLLRPSAQRAALDRFAGTAVLQPMERYTAAFAELAEVRRELRDLRAHRRERVHEADLLRFGVSEINAVAPEPGEDLALAGEVARLAHADGLRHASAQAHELIAGDPDAGGGDVVGLLAQARRALEAVAEHDTELAALAARVADASFAVADVAAELAAYTESVDADPIRLAAAQERQAALAALFRKYGDDVDAVLTWAREADERLLRLDNTDETLAALVSREAALLAELADLADDLSRARVAAAEEFARRVSVELADLAMPHAQVSVAVTQTESQEGLEVGRRRLAYGPTGVDDVELLLAPHPGAVARPVAKSASGGELSRVMLAIEVVFAGTDPVPTFVFDEVDAGVGGKAAVEIGRRLARLARDAQVIVVTHLPQVAAFADRHLVVHKSDDGSVTSSGVRRLDAADRVRELSRMLAGLETSTLAQGHAEELLATAAAAKATG